MKTVNCINLNINELIVLINCIDRSVLINEISSLIITLIEFTCCF